MRLDSYTVSACVSRINNFNLSFIPLNFLSAWNRVVFLVIILYEWSGFYFSWNGFHSFEIRYRMMANKDDLDDCDIIKQGLMVKRSQNKKRFMPINYKQRWFVLTTKNFIYYESESEVSLLLIIIQLESIEYGFNSWTSAFIYYTYIYFTYNAWTPTFL